MKEVHSGKYHRLFNAIRDTNLFGSRKLSRLLASLFLPDQEGIVISDTIYGFRVRSLY